MDVSFRWTFFLSEKEINIGTGQGRGRGASGRMALFVGRGFLKVVFWVKRKIILEQAKLGAEEALDG